MMFTLDEIEQEMRRLEVRYKATKHGPAFYFKALSEKLRSMTPHWRVSIRGGTAYTYVYADSSDEAVEKAREILVEKDLEAELADIESVTPQLLSEPPEDS